MPRDRISRPSQERVTVLLRGVEENDTSEPVVAWLLGKGQLDSEDTQAASEAIAAASRLGLAERLITLRDETPVKAIRKQAAKAIHSLKSRGEVIEEKSQGRAWSLGTGDAQYPPPKALLGFPHPDGYFPYAVLSFGAEGGVICAGMAGCVQGFREEEHAHIGRSKARQTWNDLRRRSGWVEVPFHVAKHYTERAFEAAGNKYPPGWDHVLENISDQVKENSEGLALPDAPEDAMYQVDELMKGEVRVSLMPDETALIEGIGKVSGLGEQERAEQLDQVVNEVANAALTDVQQANWALALEVTAWLAGHNNWPQMRATAFATAKAIGDGRDGAEVPFVRALVQQLLVPSTEVEAP